MAESESRIAAFVRKIDIWHVVLILPWFALAIRSGVPVRDNSYLWHVTAGRIQMASGSVITEDPFSFTRLGEPWRTQSWLAELAYAWFEDLIGLATAPLTVVVMSTVTFAAVLVLAHRLSRSLQVTAVMGVLTVDLMIGFLNPRPVIFSFVLFALFVLAERTPTLRWTLPLLFWVWASVHGSFVIGGVYLVLSGLRDRRRTAIVDTVACGVVALLTAHGWGVLDVLLGFAGGREGLATISEWATPDLLSPPTVPLLIAIVFLMWAGHLGRLKAEDFWLIIPFLILALTANRAVPPSWIALLPVLAVAARDMRLDRRSISATRGASHLAVIVVLLVVPISVRSGVSLAEGRFPVEAVQHLQTGSVFHDDAAGGYIIYSEWPERRVYVDDRAELYKGMLVTFAEARGAKPVWRDVFSEYDIREVLLRRDTPLLEVLRAEGWQQTYEDDDFEIYLAP